MRYLFILTLQICLMHSSLAQQENWLGIKMLPEKEEHITLDAGSGWAQIDNRLPLLKSGIVWNHIGNRFNPYIEDAILLEGQPVSWQMNSMGYLRMVIGEYMFPYAGAGLVLETFYMNFEGNQNYADDQLKLSGSEFRFSLASQFLFRYQSFEASIFLGLGLGFLQNYQAQYTFNHQEKFSLQDDFFNRSDFNAIYGYTLHYNFNSSWRVGLAYRQVYSTLYNYDSGFFLLPDLSTLKVTSLGLEVGYRWPLPSQKSR